MMNFRTKNRKRIIWVDNSKAIGMFFVYFGHITQEMSNKGILHTLDITKLIYSFHMPLFFILSGFFFSRRSPSLMTDIRLLVLKRVIPVFYFGAITFPFWPLLLYLANGFIDWELIGQKASNYLVGHPDLNTISWFLICLFVAEIFALVILPSVDNVYIGLIISGIFLRLGLVMTTNFQDTVNSLNIEKNIWFLHEAVVAFGFYGIGFSLFRFFHKVSKLKLSLRILLLMIFVTITLFTFDLNSPFDDFVVIMKDSTHGNNWLFLLTAITGSLSVILFSMFIPSNSTMNFIGRNSLTFIATSGLFHHFINPVFVKLLIPIIPGFWMIILSLLYSLVSLIISVPIVRILKKFTPQLVGFPQVAGRWFPALIRNSQSNNES